MNIKKLSLAAAVSALTFTTATNAVLGPIPIFLNPVKVSSNHFNDLDTKATFSSEIYTDDDIKKSNSSSIYDFLNSNTSISFTPSSGNMFVQKTDIRGFGEASGYQYIVFTVDGRRLNNIDAAPQTLNNILLSNIKKIEITKGSGSVVYGDGAMAGAVHIYTKIPDSSSVSYSVGNYGINSQSINVSKSTNKINLSANIDKSGHDGFSDADKFGYKNHANRTNKHIKTEVKITPTTKASLSFSEIDIDTRYAEPLTFAQYTENPALSGKPDHQYGHEVANQQDYVFNLKSDFGNNYTASFDSSKTTKNKNTSAWWSSTPTITDYDISTYNLKLNYQNENFVIDSGYDIYNGEKRKSGTTANKDNFGYFIQAKTLNSDITYSFGARKETIDYKWKNPTQNESFDKQYSLDALDIGVNKKIDNKLSIFSNYNEGFLAIDLDKTFETNMDNYSQKKINLNITPAKIKTLNFGLNYLTEKSKTKITLYRSNLTDEVYYVSTLNDGSNSNIDKSHKQGIEFQHNAQVSSTLNTNIGYTYTDAIIDKEATFDGNTMPGVAKHSATAALNLALNEKSKIGLTQKFRSESYHQEDFSNSSSQKQDAYYSTNISYLYRYNSDTDFNLNIDNLFARKNGTVARDNSIYSYGYTRNIKAGLTYKF